MNTALKPADIGLPNRFAAFRPGQDDIALRLTDSDNRFSFLEAPTGTGKSLIYMATAKFLRARTLVLVGTKGLQAQLTNDFASVGMRDVRGQSNYRCMALDGATAFLADYGNVGSTCEDGPCHVGVFCPMKKEGTCLYYDAQAQAKEADIVVTNYAYWMTLGRHSDPDAIGEFDLLILDEAHTAPDWLADFCAVELDRAEIRALLGLNLPPIDEGVAIWAGWAQQASITARDKYVEIRKDLDRSNSNRRLSTKRLLRLTEISRSLVEMSKAGQWKRSEGPRRDIRMPGIYTDWVAEQTEKGAKFSPVWAHAYAEEILFRGIKRVVLASATLSPSVGRYLGVDVKKCDYIEVPSGFDPKRRPFIYIPTTRVDRNMNEGQVRIWMNRIDAIIGDRLDRKGIIHTRSYERAKTILSRSKYKDHMLTHTNRNARETIALFKRAPAPCILVSPSIEEGFDFPMDECRFQIIAKVPFIDGRGPVIRARSKSDSGYLNYVAALSLVQMVGRGMRSADDICETFICDDHWAWFRRSANFPRWFKAAWTTKESVPPPPTLAPVKISA